MGNPDSDSSQNNEKEEKIIKSGLHRESLINTAVTFLSNKNIQNQDHNLLRRFLIKKGLTEDEALEAFQRFETNKSQQNLVAEYNRPQQFTAPLPLVVPPPPVPSVWHTVHSIVTTVTSIAGIFYALYWLWKTYISPYLFGRKPKKKPVETSLAELEVAVGGCVADMKSIRSSLQTLTDQRAFELTNGVVVTRIQEVKSEVNSLKALLLNRNQFPATPAPLGGPLSIPAWQLRSCGSEEAAVEHEGEGEEEGSGSNGTTNGSDSSLEIVKDPIN